MTYFVQFSSDIFQTTNYQFFFFKFYYKSDNNLLFNQSTGWQWPLYSMYLYNFCYVFNRQNDIEFMNFRILRFYKTDTKKK